MPTAQETFKQMLKEQVAPALRGLGFKGSGQNFQLPSESHWVLLGFQKWRYSDAERLQFTINLHVVERSLWEEKRQESPWIGERPIALTGYAFGWWKRIGEIIPPGVEIWWELRAGERTDDVAASVIAAVTEHALPTITEELRSA